MYINNVAIKGVQTIKFRKCLYKPSSLIVLSNIIDGVSRKFSVLTVKCIVKTWSGARAENITTALHADLQALS